MGRRSYTIIEHPGAYHNAVRRSIHSRANAKRWREWAAAHPVLAAWVEWFPTTPAVITQDGGRTYINNPDHQARHPLGAVPTFIRDAVNKWGAPTAKATEVFQRIHDERVARQSERAAQRAREAETAQAWTPGRQVVEGVVLSIKSYPGYTRWAGDTYKWLVKRDDGSRLFCTIPAGIPGTIDELKGRRVRFTVKVEPKPEEPTFAFGSRPTKASVLPSPTPERA